MNEYLTAKMILLAYGLKFGELMRLADQGLVRRRQRVSNDGEDVYTFAREDVITYLDRINEGVANDR